jgi:hypothetical protein
MAQAVDCLPSKHKALSVNLNTTKKKEQIKLKIFYHFLSLMTIDFFLF